MATKICYPTPPLQNVAWTGTFSTSCSILFSRQIQISPPDRFGIASLGVSVDVTLEAVKSAKTVIAQINPRMPRTHGDGFLHVSDIDYLVPYEEELIVLDQETVEEETAGRIAQYVSELIDDGSTLQVGYGHMPYDSLPQFLLFPAERNDLHAVFPYRRRFFPEMARDHWAAMDYRKNISLIGIVQDKGNKEIVAIGTYAKMEEKCAEVAFVVREDFQNQGIAGYIFKELERVASANGFDSFHAAIFPENTGMIHLCR